MTKHYVLVVQPTAGRPVPTQQIERVLDSAKDWARFSSTTWLFASNMSADYWYGSVRSVINSADNVIVLAFNFEDRAGWATKPIIEWFTRDHDSRPGV